jgi:hypothetical protein
MEKAGYRDTIEALHKRFPGKEVLTMKEVAEVIGKSLSAAYRIVKHNKRIGGITIADLARQICI